MKSCKSNWITPHFFTLSIVLIGLAGCQTAGPHTRNGGLAGGMAGAAIGALAGANSGKALEGALIGGTTGSILGGALGNSVDHQVASDQAYHFEREQQIMATAISIDQVIRMTQSGLDEQLIVNQINANGIERRLRPEELMMLKNNGVSNNVISAMQTAPLTSVAPRVASWGVRPTEVIVEERWIHPSPGYYFYGPPHPRYCPPGYRRHGPPRNSWEVSVGF